MGIFDIKVRILSAEKEIETLYSAGEVVDSFTISVSYTAIVIIPNSGCEVKGTFKFKDDQIMDEGWVKERIANLFRKEESCPC